MLNVSHPFFSSRINLSSMDSVYPHHRIRESGCVAFVWLRDSRQLKSSQLIWAEWSDMCRCGIVSLARRNARWYFQRNLFFITEKLQRNLFFIKLKTLKHQTPPIPAKPRQTTSKHEAAVIPSLGDVAVNDTHRGAGRDQQQQHSAPRQCALRLVEEVPAEEGQRPRQAKHVGERG